MRVWDDVEKAYRDGTNVRGRIIDRIKGGLAVDIGVKAFLPGSLVDTKPVKNLDFLRGKEFDFKVISVDKKRGNIVLSRKAVIEVEQEAEEERRPSPSSKRGASSAEPSRTSPTTARSSTSAASTGCCT